MDIGKKLKETRTSLNISMNEIARLTGLAQSGLSEIESGNRSPSFDTLEKIITLGFGITLSDFFLDSNDYPPEILQLIKTTSKLSSQQLTKLNEFIKSMSN